MRPKRPSLVDGLALAALSVVVSRTALREVPEVFALGAETGEALSDLGLAYLSAWIFHLLVVVKPRQRDQERIQRRVGIHLYELSRVSHSVFHAMERQMGKQESGSPSMAHVKEVCAAINPNNESPVIALAPDRVIRPLTWVEFIRARSDLTRELRSDLLPTYTYFDVELVARLHAEADAESTWRFFVDQAAGASNHLPNATLQPAAPHLYDYMEKSWSLYLYLSKRPLRRKRRL